MRLGQILAPDSDVMEFAIHIFDIETKGFMYHELSKVALRLRLDPQK